MAKIEKRPAKKWFKCVCCTEQVRTDEKYFQVVENDGKDRRGEKYCIGCEKYALANNDDIGDENDDGEQHLRAMEDFGAYKAAGCTDAYWTDRDAGFCN